MCSGCHTPQCNVPFRDKKKGGESMGLFTKPSDDAETLLKSDPEITLTHDMIDRVVENMNQEK